jgi:hypothetical protein
MNGCATGAERLVLLVKERIMLVPVLCTGEIGPKETVSSDGETR